MSAPNCSLRFSTKVVLPEPVPPAMPMIRGLMSFPPVKCRYSSSSLRSLNSVSTSWGLWSATHLMDQKAPKSSSLLPL